VKSPRGETYANQGRLRVVTHLSNRGFTLPPLGPHVRAGWHEAERASEIDSQVPRKTVRCFPDKLPMGIETEDTSRFVFLYLVNRQIPVDFCQFLIRHHNLLLNLHRWTVRLLVPRRLGSRCRSTRPRSEKNSGPL
jgi:hypothetical protein